MLFKGRAKCKWGHHRGIKKSKEIYFKTKSVFINDNCLLPAGTHIYNVECNLLDSLPESFEGKYGGIFYEAIAIHEIPWRMDDKSRTPFTVERKNNLPPTKESTEVNKDIKFCSGCLLKDCKVKIELPQGSDYGAGDTIPIKIKLDNKSSVEIKQVRIELTQCVRYTVSGMCGSSKEEISKVVKVEKEFEGDEIETFINLPPLMIKSNGQFCKNIHITYNLSVEFNVDPFHVNPKINIPIGIGEKHFAAESSTMMNLIFLTVLIILIAIFVFASIIYFS